MPGVVVVHEITGFNTHIRDIVRRLGEEGFMAIAPDAFSPLGGSPKDIQKAFSMFRELNNKATVKNYIAAQKYLHNHPISNGNVGVVGFCRNS